MIHETNNWLRSTFKQGDLRPTNIIGFPGEGMYYQELRPRAICKDGFSVSIQASHHMYCSPRADGNIAYESVELGFPSAEDKIINGYAEEPGNYTETVYGYVPVGVVDQLLKKHGGIVNWPKD